MRRGSRMLAVAPLICVITVGPGETPPRGVPPDGVTPPAAERLPKLRLDGGQHVFATAFGSPVVADPSERNGPATPTA